MDSTDLQINYQNVCDLKLTDGVNDYYVLPNNAIADPESRTIRFTTAHEAEKLIDTSIRCTGEKHLLQNFLSKNNHGSLWSCSDKKLQKLTADLIINREIVIAARSSSGYGYGNFSGYGQEEKAYARSGFRFALPGFGGSKISYKIVEDKTGDYIPGIFMKVNLPDDRFKELASDIDGKIIVENVRRGVSGFDLDVSTIFGATLENTFAYVTVDSKPTESEEEESPNNAKRVHNRLKSKNRKKFRYLADIIEYQVAEGETFSSIARDNGFTFRELAFFNWSEYERTKLVTLMERDIGCSQKTPDGRDFQFTGDESPGIVYIPSPLSVTDLEINLEHTIRVKRVGYPLRYLFQIDLDNPDSQNDTITLYSNDKTWEYKLCIKDLEVIEKDWVELVFPCPPVSKTYSMIHDPLDGEDPYYIFQDYSHSELYFDEPEVYDEDDDE